MNLRIPPDASVGVQQALRDLDARIDQLQNGTKQSESVSIETIKHLIREALPVNNYPPVADIMRPSGPSHMHGFVPDPGAGAGTDAVLHEDAKWKWPLSGNLVNVTDVGDPINKYNLHGGLAVNGPVSSSALMCDDLTAYGYSHGVATTLFQNHDSTLVNSTTVETTIVEFPIKGGTLTTNWSILVDTRFNLAANGNTKTVKLKFGTTSFTAYTSTGSGLRVWVRAVILGRGTNVQAITGFSVDSGGTVALPAGPGGTENTSNDVNVTLTFQGGGTTDITLVSSNFLLCMK